MKKIFPLFILILSTCVTVSCSKDDDKTSTESISVKINGFSKSFNNVSVTEEPHDGYSDFFVESNQTDDDSKQLNLRLAKDTGSDLIYFIQYYDGEKFYTNASGDDVYSVINEGSDTSIKGTFSANLVSADGSIIEISEGNLNISH